MPAVTKLFLQKDFLQEVLRFNTEDTWSLLLTLIKEGLDSGEG